jgi:Rod binding domain-containing protein
MQAIGIGAERVAGPAGVAAPQPRLVRAAHEFEAMMMKELLKPMTGEDADSGDGDSGSTGALGEFASEALGQALSSSGGFGIANEIVRSISHSGNQHPTGKVTGNRHEDTGIKTHE